MENAELRMTAPPFSTLHSQFSIETRLRHARYYVQIASHSQWELYLKGQVIEALALFDRERRQIDAGWQWAMDHSRYATPDTRTPDPDVDRLLLDFANATAYVGQLRYDVRRERIPQLEAQRDAARRLGRKEPEMHALNNIGRDYNDIGNYHQAIESLEQSLAVAREIGHRQGEGNALGNLGIAYKNLGEYQRAIEYYEQQLVIVREIGDRRGEGQALGNLGIAYKNLGEYQRAIEYYEQGLVIDREIGDIQGEATDSWNLGLLYERQGELTRAEPLIAHAAAFMAQIGHATRADQAAQKLAAVRAKLREGGG
jgi:tetratricopeptide (TPR) repeat protein